MKINFQDAATTPPNGYLKDNGQPFGLRTGSDQGSSVYTYGWKAVATNNPADLTTAPPTGNPIGSARNRATTQTDLRLDTLVHMDHPTTGAIEAYWEIVVPNGQYEVTVAVGDAASQGSDATDSQVINVEGVNFISNFQTSAASGSNARHTTATNTVTVSDGLLTIDQNGGENTKIDYVDIAQAGNALQFDRPTLSLVIPINSSSTEDVVLSTTTGTVAYNIDLTGQPSWLTSVTGAATVSTSGENISITVDTTGLSIGDHLTYTLNVTATDYTSDSLDIVLDVISDQLQVNPNDTSPLDGATGVDINSSITANFLNTSGGGLDSNLDVTEAMFFAYPTALGTSASIAANRNTTGGGDSITLVPTQPLAESTQYTVEVTNQLLDINDNPVIPYSWTFTTGVNTTGTIDDVEFEKINLSNDGNAFWSQLTIGPDGRLYAATIGSGISRWDIAADGTISNRVDLNIPSLSGRAIVGLLFDPQGTANNPILYVTSNAGNLSDSANFTGKLVRLNETDAGLTNLVWTYTELVDRLPRSKKDHLSNSLVWGPNGERALYMTQGSLSAMGAPDGAWGNRNEVVLSAAVLRYSIDALNNYADTNGIPYDVWTDDKVLGDPALPYNPQAPGALVTLFATGTRNAYDLVWHTNNNLYVPTNGSAGGGNSPGTPNPLPIACEHRIDDATNGDYTGPTVPAVNNHPTQRDYLFRIPIQGGTFHGHPNPTRCEWVLNGGNLTSSTDDYGEAIGGSKYSVGVQPDRNYAGYAYDFLNNKSANGVIEYKSNTFGGALKGSLIVVRYSQKDDLFTMFPDGSNGDISTTYEGVEIPGFSGFSDPLDLTEDLSNGNIYVADNSGIWLLRPVGSVGVPSPDIATSPDQLIFDQVTSDGASAAKVVTVSNTGTASLNVTASIVGTNANQYAANKTSFSVAAGASTTVNVTFDPSSNGPKFALLRLASNDVNQPQVDIALAGLGKQGLGGSNEPSLQWVIDTFGLGINSGDTNASTNAFDVANLNSLAGDEVAIPLFERATDALVELELLAVFGPTGSNPVVNVGYYTESNSGSPIQVFSVDNTPTSNGQSLVPPINTGSLSFDPGVSKFGFYSEWPAFGNRRLFQQDALNTFSGNIPHHVRIYPVPGEINSYLVVTEETTSGFDYQDVVYIAHNVRPAIPSPIAGGLIRLENMQWQFPANADNAGIEHFNSWMAFNTKPTATANGGSSHTTATLRIHNDDTEALTITGLSFSGTDNANWTLPNSENTALPLTINAGDYYDLSVQFVATSNKKVHRAQLNIASSDVSNPTVAMKLGGYWQSQSEGGQEPTVAQIAQAYGFGTTIVGSGQNMNNGGRVMTIGEEVLSQSWKRADTTKPVFIRQLSAFHTCCANTATVKVQQNIATTGTTNLFTHAGVWAQSFLPLLSNGNPAQGTITPSNALFGFAIDSEFGDWTRNNASPDVCNTTPEEDVCGHHVRFWPMRDNSGALIPNAWMMVMDYSGINYDFNDNVYYVTNIQPANATYDLVNFNVSESNDPVAFGDEVTYTFTVENNGLYNSEAGTFTFDVTGNGTFLDAYLGDTPPDTEPEAPTVGPVYRINAGGSAINTPSGAWIASQFFTGGRASNPTTAAIANTTDDAMYQTEWSANSGNFSFSAPVDNGDYTVRLHFVETWFTGESGHPTAGANKRKFNVTLEGATVLTGYDPFVAAGAALTANVQEFNVTISDGTVSLGFLNGGANNPTISGIEIIGSTSGGGGGSLDCTANVCSIPATVGNSSFLVSARVSADTVGSMTVTGTVNTPNDSNTANDVLAETTQIFDPDQLPGTITIIKQASPQDGTVFSFSGDLGDFELADSGGSVTGDAIKFNFQLDGAPVPAGYLADVGEAYGAQPTGYTHGWFNLNTNQPIDASGTNATNGAMRDRNRSGIAQELDTIVHFQRADVTTITDGWLTPLYWELELPNGDYRVTVSVGDEPGGTGYDSQHQIRIEGQNVFASPQQLTAGNEYTTGTIDVTISDGRLTMDGVGGSNSKANYIIIESLGAPNVITFENQIPTTYNINELSIPGWALATLVCDDNNSTVNVGTATATIVLDAQEDVTCTFTNSAIGLPEITVSPAELVFSGLKGSTSAPQAFTVTNTGTGILQITGANIVGTNASDFSESNAPINVLAGQSTTLNVTFTPGANTVGALSAQLEISSSDANTPTATVDLYGLSANAYEGGNEPALALVTQTLGYDFNVGWTSLTSSTSATLVGDEVDVKVFQKAGSGDVTILPVARYSPAETLPFGFYIPDGSSTPPTTQVGILATTIAEAQRLFPTVATGGTTFDPGNAGFGIYVFSNSFGRTNYSEDALNAASGVAHRARVYQMKDRNGVAIPNSYFIAFEDAANGDYQDYDFVLSNVEPYDPDSLVECSPISQLNCNEVPVTLPFILDWSADEAGLVDNANVGTGFTMVDPPSARLITEDGAISFPTVPGYEPSKLDVDTTAGTLTITSNKGIMYSQPTGSPNSPNTNSQINALGVGIDVNQVTFVETTIQNLDFTPSTGTNSQQAGIWYGISEDQYAKLEVIRRGTNSGRVQLLVEDVVNNTTPATAFFELNGADITNLSAQTINLRLVIDPTLGTVAGIYSLDGGTTEIQVANSVLALPSVISAGVDHDADGGTDPISYAGLFATYRNAANSFDATFNNFSVFYPNVTDTVPPVISLVDSNPLQLVVGDTYLEPGATALDNVDGDLSASIVINASAVNTGAAGSYDVTYNVSDLSGNPALEVIRTVNVIELGTGDIFIIKDAQPDSTVSFGFTGDLGAFSLVDDGNAAPININFQATGAAPLGYEADNGLAYNAGRGYGWLSVTTGLPFDGSANARNRSDVTITLANTLMHLRYNECCATGTTGTQEPLFWEIDVPNGVYDVVVSLGDSNTDSTTTTTHIADVEGVLFGTAIKTPQEVSGRVTVSDGKLTLDQGAGGFNTKINYIEITPVTSQHFNVSAGNYAVTESATAGWALDSLVCSDLDSATDVGTATASIALATDEVVVCTFTNVAGDAIAPIISLIGDNPLEIMLGMSYTDPGYSAIDDVDGDISGDVVVAGDVVDTNTEGTYNVTYNVSDAAGNPATEVVRTVNVVDASDGTPPIISLIGDNPLEIMLGVSYTDPGYSAIDDVDGDISGDVVVAGDVVDTNTEGTYNVTYNVSDAAGNPATEVVRTVNVVDTSDGTAPIISLIGDNPLEIMLGVSYTDPGYSAIDDVDGDISGDVVVAGDVVDTNTEGTYNVTYNVSDAAGNAALQVTRVVNVVDTTPAITFAGIVQLQGRNDHSSTSISVTFYTLGSDSVEHVATATTDASGNFTMSGLTAGTYDVAVKHPMFLMTVQEVTIVSGANNHNFGTLFAGDANNDNTVNIGDFGVLSPTFGKSLGELGYDARADFNGNNTVDIGDFGLLSSNFYLDGDAPGN